MITLLRDYLRRSWLLAALASAAVFAFFMLACRVFLQIQQQGGGLPITRLVPKWVQTAFSFGPSSMSDINGFLSICFQHPFVLTITLAMPIALITGFLSGDVEKRSISLILCRPVGRVQVVFSTAILVMFLCLITVLAAIAGIWVGAEWTNQTPALNQHGIRQATFALGTLIFAFTGISAAISAMLNVRGDAVGWGLTVVLVMYVWNFLAQVWYGGGGMVNYSLFRFYQPTDILLKGSLNLASLQVLIGTGLAGWIISALVFRFRNFSV